MLARLSLRRFRNVESLDWEPDAGPQVLLGSNGAGKTSVLEAIYLLATTRSFRTARLDECVRHGDEGFVARAELGDPPRLLEMVRTASGDRRTCDGAKVTAADWLRVQSVSLWSSADLEILIGAPGARRRFLDRGIVGSKPASLDFLRRYRQTLREKRELLRTGGHGLDVWNDVLAGPAAEICRRRADYVTDLGREVRTFLGSCDLPTDAVDIAYRPSLESALEGPEAVRAELGELEERERRVEAPVRGPHRDRLRILWRGKPVAAAASAGERKLVGLALAAGHARVLGRREPRPILLLDDLDAELDHERLAALWRGLADLGQILATSNRAEMFDAEAAPAPARAWRLDAGRML